MSFCVNGWQTVDLWTMAEEQNPARPVLQMEHRNNGMWLTFHQYLVCKTCKKNCPYVQVLHTKFRCFPEFFPQEVITAGAAATRTGKKSFCIYRFNLLNILSNIFQQFFFYCGKSPLFRMPHGCESRFVEYPVVLIQYFWIFHKVDQMGLNFGLDYMTCLTHERRAPI